MENYLDELPELEDEITERRLVECVREQVKKDVPCASSFYVGGIFQLKYVFGRNIVHYEHVWLIEANIDNAPMMLYRVRGLTEECLEAVRVF